MFLGWVSQPPEGFIQQATAFGRRVIERARADGASVIETEDPGEFAVHSNNKDEKATLRDEKVSRAFRELNQRELVRIRVRLHRILRLLQFRFDNERYVSPSIRMLLVEGVLPWKGRDDIGAGNMVFGLADLVWEPDLAVGVILEYEFVGLREPIHQLCEAVALEGNLTT